MNWVDRIAIACFSFAILIWIALLGLLWLVAQVVDH